MKKLFLLIISFLFIYANANVLKGGVVEEVIPKGFFGSWGVISKLESSTNNKMFNQESKDIWTLGGYSNILILQNLESGAYSEIYIEEKPKDGKTLKFERKKEVVKEEFKIIYTEKVVFILNGNNFSGTDEYFIEKFDKQNKLIEKNSAKYHISGVKFASS